MTTVSSSDSSSGLSGVCGVAGGGGVSVEEELMSLLSRTTTGDGEFSISGYLNLALSGCDDDDRELQQRMAELALQLQLQTQACHDDIGRIGAELQAILPRCHADVGRIGVGLQGLQQDAATLAAHCSTGNDTQQVSSSLETLSTLHALQANLSRTHEILTAAATWDSTLQEIPPLLAAAAPAPAPAAATTTAPSSTTKEKTAEQTNTTTTGTSSSTTTTASSNLPLAVQKLLLLEKGEQALRGMPNPEERTAAIRKLRVQISQLLQPQLQHALQHMSSRLGPLQQCVSLYSQLDLLPQLVKTYVASRPTALHKAWFDFRPPPSASSSSQQQQQQQQHFQSPDASSSSPDFSEWISAWLDSVLQLLQEERRQASAVFGAQKVPTLMALVLQETFRPLLNSFAARLPQSQLPIVCHVYKATLHFLSLCYETIAACYLDWTETNPNAAATATVNDVVVGGGGEAALYRQIMTIFQQIISPFRKYQTAYTMIPLEEQAAKQAFTQDWKPKITAVMPGERGPGAPGTGTTTTSSTVAELDDLTRATDAWWQVTTDLVRPAQEVLARLEFFQGACCHGVSAFLNIMDQVTAERLQLLTNCVQQLSQAVHWATNFDEPHVLAALQVLKLAAVVQSSCLQLQTETKQRLALAQERLATVLAREAELLASSKEDNNNKNRRPEQLGVFGMPDSLSPVEINAALVFLEFASTQEAESALTLLQRLSSSSSSSSSTLATTTTTTTPQVLGQTLSAVSQFIAACHKFVFQACVAVPYQQMQSMAALSSWKSSAGTSGGGGAGVGDDHMSYGTLPQPYITQVGEHMLALVQALEPFALDRESLVLANTVLEHMPKVAEQPWRELVQTLANTGLFPSSVSTAVVVPLLMNGSKGSNTELQELVVGGGKMVLMDDVEDEDDDQDDEDVNDKEVTAFCNKWLDVVGLAVTGRLLERILNIPSLTAKGCDHLVADLGYLQNVLVALGVAGHPHVLIGHVAELVSLDLTLLQERIRSRNNNNNNKSDYVDTTTSTTKLLPAALWAMEERLAAMKGAES